MTLTNSMASPERSVSIWRFIAAECGLTLGALLAWRCNVHLTLLGYLLMNTSYYCIPAKRWEALDRAVKWKGGVLIFGVLLIFEALIYFGPRYMPGDDALGLLKHPGTLSVIWVMFTFFSYTRWTRANKDASYPHSSSPS
jgi:hypothetical protein